MEIGGKSRLWILGVAAIIGMLVYFLDPPTSVTGQYPGQIVSTYPLGKNRNGYGTVQVRLQGGQVVLSSIPTSPHFPYPDGTKVIVTAFDSFLFNHRSYTAELAPSRAGP
jgi:hypothetical protein